MPKMMLRSCPSPLFVYRHSVSDPHLENVFSSPAWDSTKCISNCGTTPRSHKGEGGLSPRRPISQSNSIPNLHRNEGKWRCSWKNGLLVAADEFNKVDVRDRRVDPLNWQCKEEDQKQSNDMKSELLDRSPSVSGNSRVGENYSSLQAGPNGHPSAIEYATKGKDSNRFGGNRGSSGVDLDGTNAYYEKMLESNPGNPLLLTNYAKFLHEVQQDFEKAEKYYKRALLASPGDGEILSLYAKFIWETHNDVAQAEVYFRKALEFSPEDCYVVASYAHFLWNSQDDEEEEENEPSVTMTSSTYGSTAAAA